MTSTSKRGMSGEVFFGNTRAEFCQGAQPGKRRSASSGRRKEKLVHVVPFLAQSVPLLLAGVFALRKALMEKEEGGRNYHFFPRKLSRKKRAGRGPRNVPI